MKEIRINSGSLAQPFSGCTEIRHRNISLMQNTSLPYEVASLKKAAVKLSLCSRIMMKDLNAVEKVCDECVCGFSVPQTPAEKQLYEYINHFISAKVVRPEDLDTEAVIDAVKYMAEPQNAAEWVRGRVAALEFSTAKTGQIQANIAAQQVLRYLRCEPRTPLLVYCPKEDINIGNGIVSVTAPDIIYADSHAGVDYAEAVKIRTGKTDMSERRSASKMSVDRSLEMYAMLKYAADVFTHVYGKASKKGSAIFIKSSYYFLRRDDDTAKNFDSHFFPFTYETDSGRGATNTGHNVYTLWVNAADRDAIDEIEENYDKLAEEYRIGSECTESMCERCPRNNLCNYNRMPIVSCDPKPRMKATEINLSTEQQKVVDFRKGIARVNAGAGAGKTLVVALRTALMISEGVDPASMLMITFTNAGADEMRERILFYIDDLGVDTNGMNINVTTFNAFGNSIIQNEYKRFGFAHEPRLIDDIERKSIIRELLNSTVIDGLDYRNFTMDFGYVKGALAATSELFSIIKKNRIPVYDAEALMEQAKDIGLDKSIQDERTEKGDPLLPYAQILQLYQKYEAKLHDDCLIEYADQESLVFDLLEMDPYYFDQLGIAHITVDEYQDTSEAQNELVAKMCESENFESLLAVGDDSQSIFSFRDARPENIVNFFDTFGTGKDMYLVNNYRCSPEIIRFANNVNRRNQMRVDKDLIATRPSQGIPVKVLSFTTKKDNYEWIAESIAEKIKSGVAESDIEIQAATKNELLEMASVLAAKGIKTFVSCPEPMLDNSRIKGIIAMSRAISNPHASKSILEYCNALCDGNILSMNDSEIQDLEEEYAEKFEQFRLLPEKEKSERFDQQALEIAGSDDIAINFAERLQRFSTVADKAKYIDDFISLGGEMLKREERLDGVTLSTVHSSKGLEWSIVYIIETKFCPRGTFSEERRRLLFVAATRAKNELFVTGLKMIGRGKQKYANVMLAQCFDDAGIERKA